MESKRNLTGEGGDQNSNGIAQPSKSPSYMDELSSVPTSLPPQTQRYGPPPTVANNSGYSRTTNNYHHEEPQRPMSGQQNHHVMAPPQHHQINHPVVNNSSPYSARGAPNVIYSSDGSAGQFCFTNNNVIYSTFIVIIHIIQFAVSFITKHFVSTLFHLVNANASRKVGSIADYDPVNNYFGSLDPQRPVRNSYHIIHLKMPSTKCFTYLSLITLDKTLSQLRKVRVWRAIVGSW